MPHDNFAHALIPPASASRCIENAAAAASIPNEIDAQESGLGELHSAIDLLTNRLEYALHPEQDNENTLSAVPTPPVAQHVQILQQHNDSILQATNRIHQLVQRLAL